MLHFQLYDTSSKYLETWIWLSPLAIIGEQASIIMARRARVMTARAADATRKLEPNLDRTLLH